MHNCEKIICQIHTHKYIFVKEYQKFLQQFEVDFDERYFFKNRYPFLMTRCWEGEYSMLSLWKKAVCLKSAPLKGLSELVGSRRYQEYGPNGPSNLQVDYEYIIRLK